jgi:hypothetical protein
MSTAEMLFEKAKNLPENLQAEVLHYVNFLLTRRIAEKEGRKYKSY